MDDSAKTPRALRAAARGQKRHGQQSETGFSEAQPRASKGKTLAKKPKPAKAATPAGLTTPAGHTIPAGSITPLQPTTVTRDSIPPTSPIPEIDPAPVEDPTPAGITTPPAGRQLTPLQQHTFPPTRRTPTTRTPHDTEDGMAVSDDDYLNQLLNIQPETNPPSRSTPTRFLSTQRFGNAEVPPPGPLGSAENNQDRFFQRLTLASASFDLPWPFCELFALQTLRLEYKRLALSPQRPAMPFDIYTIQLCGVSNNWVSHGIRRFVTPHTALHQSTRIVDNNQILEGYQPILGHEYSSPDLPEAHWGIIDAKNDGNHAIYNISEFSFHLDNAKRAWMDSLLPVVCFLYHLILTYLRYLAVTSDFLPILGNCSFATRMMARVGFGLFSTYIHSDVTIFGRSIFGVLVQWFFYSSQSHTPEIRDSFKATPFYYWLLIHGFFYLFARFFNTLIAENEMEDMGWLLGFSYHAIWDIIGMSLDPLPIAIKLGCGYYTYHCVTKHYHLLSELYTRLLQTAEHAEDEVRVASAIWEKINNATAIAKKASLEL